MADEYNSLQDQQNDDEDTNEDKSNGDGESSEDIDDGFRFGRRNLPRHRYKTVDASSDSEDDFDNPVDRKRRRLRHKEENIYGIFVDSEDENKKKTGKIPRKNTKSNLGTPIFIKGQVENIQSDNNLQQQHDNLDKNENVQNDMVDSERDLSNKGDINFQDSEDIELKRKEEDANETFLALLNAGRRKASAKGTSSFHKTNAFEREGDLEQSNLPGIGFGSKKSLESNADSMHQAAFTLTSTSTIGMLPSQFGAKSQLSSTVKKDPNVGKWEKHTKGIGMKLLSKMGYKGSGGLGKRKEHQETGIDRPIEVKVRPSNLGLGFGNFQEASKLKANQIIEAKVSGKIEDDEQKKEAFVDGIHTTSRTSTLPSNADLLGEQSWKKGSKIKRQGKRKRTFVEYKELLQKQQSESGGSVKIIDMRGPPSIRLTDEKPPEIPIGEELLHNISLLLHTYETKLISSNQFASSMRRKLDSIKSDLVGNQQREQTIQDRKEKLRRVQDSMDEIELMLSNINVTCKNFFDLLRKVIKEIENLGTFFSEEERSTLHFSSSVVPALLEPVIKARLDAWKPLYDGSTTAKEVIRFILLLIQEDTERTNNLPSFLTNNTEELKELRSRLFIDFLLPRMTQELESSRWNPVTDSETALQLYESMQEVIEHEIIESTDHEPEEDVEAMKNVFISVPAGSDDKLRSKLSNLMRAGLVHRVVFQKLLTSLDRWEPRLAGTDKKNYNGVRGLVDRPDLWILPWIVHLTDQPALTTQLVSECKRKVKIALSYLQKTILPSKTIQGFAGPEEEYFYVCLQLLRPWRTVFKQETIQSMVSDSIVPRIARYMSLRITLNSVFGRNEKIFLWSDLDILYRMHSLRLMSNSDFLSILEGEILSFWAGAVHQWLSEKRSGEYSAEVVGKYVEWKRHIFQARPIQDERILGSMSDEGYRSSNLVLQQDNRICACFYATLSMIQAAQSGDTNSFRNLRPPPSNNYRVVLAHRKADARQQAADDLVRMHTSGTVIGKDNGEIEARVRLNRASCGVMPTFRDVVAEFARERDILFQPRFGANAFKDGKQTFLFGSIPIYLNGTVVYALIDGDWKGISLDSLAKQAG